MWRRLFALTAVALKLQYLLYEDISPWDGTGANWFQRLFCGSITSFAKFWHGYEIHGIEELKKNKGNCLLIGYHSRCTIDLFYILCTLRCNVLASYLFFKVQLTRHFMPLLGVIPSKTTDGGTADDAFVNAMSTKPQPLMLLPGGAFEFLKIHSQQHKVVWKDQPGFVRVIFKHPEMLGKHTKVFVFYSRNCERCYYSNPFWHDVTGEWALRMYESFKAGNLMVMPAMMLTMLFSIGFVILPNPVKVETFLSPPMCIAGNESPEAFAERVRSTLQDLINNVESSPVVDQRGLVHKLAMVPYGVFTAIQNTVMYAITSALILSTYPPILLYSGYNLFAGYGKEKKDK
jgi:hypothetical protein